MFYIKKFLVIGFLLICFSFSAFSLDTPTFYEEEIVVTASRYPQFISEVPWNVTIVNNEEIKASGARNLGDALRSSQGMDIKANGFQGSVASFKLRGVTAEQVLVLVDGKRIASPLLGMADAGDIPIENIERVEIVRGASSSLYGSDAIGGVINIITKKPSDKSKTVIGLLSGTYGTQQLTLSTSGKSGIGYQFSGSFDKTDGFRENSASQQQKYSGKLIFDINDTDEISVGLGAYSAYKEVPNVPSKESEPLKASTPDDWQKDRNAYFDLSYKKTIDEDSSFTIKAYQDQQVQDTGLYDFSAKKFVNSNYYSLTNAFEIQHVFRSHENNMLSYGIDWREEIGKSHDAGEHTVNNIAFYLQDEIKPSSKLLLVLGARGDKHTQSGDNISPRIGVKYDIDSTLSLRSSYGSSFRSPTLNQLYWNNPAWLMYGDEDLRPEKAISYDIGLNKRLNNSFNVNIGYFTTLITDMIVWDYNVATFTWTVSNVDSASIQGLEIGAEYSPFSWLNSSVNYTSQNPVRIHDKEKPSNEGKDLEYTPRTKTNISVSVGKKDIVLFNINNKFVGRRYANGSNSITLNEYSLVDLRLLRSFGYIDTYINIENLQDIEYYESVGYHPFTWASIEYPMPGRRILFGLKYNI